MEEGAGLTGVVTTAPTVGATLEDREEVRGIVAPLPADNLLSHDCTGKLGELVAAL